MTHNTNSSSTDRSSGVSADTGTMLNDDSSAADDSDSGVTFEPDVENLGSSSNSDDSADLETDNGAESV